MLTEIAEPVVHFLLLKFPTARSLNITFNFLWNQSHMIPPSSLLATQDLE